MKKIDELGSLLEKLLNAKREEVTVKSDLGVIPKELIDVIVQVEHDYEDLQDEVSRKLEDAAKKVKRESEHRLDAIKAREEAFWKAVYACVGSDGKGNHTINRKTGMVSLVVSTDDDMEEKIFQ